MAVAHHANTIGDVHHYTHVVGDEQHGGAVLVLQFADQLEDLLLGRHVQRGGRLVGDQQTRFQNQRHGNHDALTLPAAELMRVSIMNMFDVRQVHLGQRVHHLCAALCSAKVGVGLQHFVDLPPHAQHWIQRCHRLLKNHRHTAAAERLEPAIANLQHVFAIQQNASADDIKCVLGQQSESGQRSHRLA